MMKVQQWLVTAALALAVPALASAQGGTTSAQDPASTTGQTTTGTTETSGATGTTGTTGSGTAGATGTTGSAATAETTTATQQGFGNLYDTDAPSHWTASGFVGSHFGESVEGSQLDFGGSLGYMWRGAFGAEFLAGFSPNFQFANNILGEEPQINTYMGNLIGAIPLGFDANWQPFVSGGIGAITMRSDFGDELEDTFDADDSQLGGNIGFGVMGFAGAWGVRGDVRYFRGFNGDDAGNSFGQAVLSELDFWRANIGVAVRW
jgi:hypothetical protein